jgi:xanthine dehydrogenase D subunit
VSAGTLTRVGQGIGTSARRVDGVPKVQGQYAYGSDLWAEGMLWGMTLRSPFPHARIASVDVSKAVTSAGVRAVLTEDDVPGKKTFGLEFADQPVMAFDRVRYMGEPVAIVAAEHPEQARRALKRIAVEYEPLPVLADMEEALRPDAPRLHDFGNVLRHLKVLHGDPDAAADVWVEGYYETGMQDQAALGPEGGLALPSDDGGVDLYVATQWLQVDRQQIAPCLGLPLEKVRLYMAGVGGAFGSREDLNVQIHACMLALRTGRPIKMVYGREESFFGHVHRHPFRIWMRTGATRDGRLVSVRARLLCDGGAYASSSPAVIGNATTFACGPYEVPNSLVEGTCVYTNNPPCGAMRGFGAPQVCFAHESQMDKLAASLGMDPVELRLQNALQPGSMLPTGRPLHGAAPVREVIERVRDLPMPDEAGPSEREPVLLPGGAGNVTHGEGIARGVGYAVGYKNIAYSEGFDDSSEVEVALSMGAGAPVAQIHTAGVDYGQGLHTVVAQIARTELGIDDVVVRPPDTVGIESSGSSSASRQTLMTGGAVHLACAAVRRRLFERVRALNGIGMPGAESLSVEDGRVLAGGTPVGAVAVFLADPIFELASQHPRTTTPLDENGQGDPHVEFSFAAERAVVEVDRDLGLVRVVQIAACAEVGRAINPQGVEGQIEGGTAQGIGLALLEELHLQHGVIRNPSFTDYLLPTFLDMPPVVTEIVEEPEPGAPMGVKGVGEHGTVVSTAAVVAAVRDATGLELNRVPVRPDDLVGLRGLATTSGWPPVPDVPGNEPIPKYAGMALGQSALDAKGVETDQQIPMKG